MEMVNNQLSRLITQLCSITQVHNINTLLIRPIFDCLIHFNRI